MKSTSHDFFPALNPQYLHYKTNCYLKIHWSKNIQNSDLTLSPAINITSCLPITSAPSGCEAGRGGVHITRRDDLHFRLWIHQVGSAFNRIAGVVGLCWGGWTSDGDYWVTCLGGGWSLLGGVFPIMSLNEFELEFVAKYPSLVMVFFRNGFKPPTRWLAVKFL